MSFCQESDAPVSPRVGGKGRQEKGAGLRGTCRGNGKAKNGNTSALVETRNDSIGLVHGWRGLKAAKCVLLRADRQDRAGKGVQGNSTNSHRTYIRLKLNKKKKNYECMLRNGEEIGLQR